MKSYKKIGIWGLGVVACFGVMVAGFYLGEFGAKKSGRIIPSFRAYYTKNVERKSHA